MSDRDRQTASRSPRSHFATIRDVAELAGVSRAAVSKVIGNVYGVSPAMRSRVEAAMAELDYRPSAAARSLRGRTSTVGIELPDISNPFFGQLIVGAIRMLESSAFQLVVAPSLRPAETRARAIELLVDRRVEGFIAVSPLITPEHLERIAARTPAVVLGDHAPSLNYDTITNDDDLGAVLALTHLFDLGHRRIAHLTIAEGIREQSGGAPHALRHQAYLRWMRERGLEREIRVVAVGADAEAGAAVHYLLGGAEPPTAVFAGHDALALESLRARIELGIGAGALSIVGYDDVPIAGHPGIGLTTLDQHGERSGERAAALLIERIEGRREAVHEQLPPTLRVRTSTAPVE